MTDYSKWDKLELSDDSDIEVHPNVDKRSFIRAKQRQIHVDRQQRKLRIETLKHQQIVNETLAQRLTTLISSVKTHSADFRSQQSKDVAFRLAMELAAINPEDDRPPPQPEMILDESPSPPKPQAIANDGQSLPTYSKMIMTILDEVDQKLDQNEINQEKRYDAFLEELSSHLRAIEDFQNESLAKLAGLEEKETTKITSESYRTGFDTSRVNKSDASEKSKVATKLELLNPNYGSDNRTDSTDLEASENVSKPGDGNPRLSLPARAFANIRQSDYRAIYAYLSSHPELLRESVIDSLLIEAVNILVEQKDHVSAFQHVHRATLLEFCHSLGQDGVAIFFKRMTSPEGQARELFDKQVTEKYQGIIGLAKKQQVAQQNEGVEQIQIQAAEPGTVIRIRIPDEHSEDHEIKEARATFDAFPSVMRAALQSGSIDKVNEVLGAMDVAEAERLVDLLSDAGCLNIEEGLIDATTKEGQKRLEEIKKSAVNEA